MLHIGPQFGMRISKLRTEFCIDIPIYLPVQMFKVFKPEPIFLTRPAFRSIQTQPSQKKQIPSLQKAVKSRSGEDASAHAVPVGLLVEPPLLESGGDAPRADGGHGDSAAVSDRRWAGGWLVKCERD